MPYIGQSPATGEANSFKTLDDITSYTLTFDGSSASTVSVANDTITEREHRFVTGQRVTYNDGGGTAITGLSDGVYYIIVEDRHTFKLATSANNAASGTAINLTGLGVGASHTLNVAFDGVNTKFKATINNGTKADITSAPQLMLSINGVLQQPHNNTTTPATGYAVDHTSTIIFSAAPAANDQFFGSLVASNFATFDISDNTVDNFTGDGSVTDFTLSKEPPNNESVLVTIDGVVQYPDDTSAVRAYSVSGNILSFVAAPGNGVEIQVRHIGFAGASTGGISGFYGRTGNAVLKSTDNIVFNNATASGTVQAANVTVTGDLTVNGTTTTLDTALTEVDKLEVGANNTTVAVAVTQSGSGDAAYFMGGDVGIGTNNPQGKLHISDTDFPLIIDDNSSNVDKGIAFTSGGSSTYKAAIRLTPGGADKGLRFHTGGYSNSVERLRITSDGKVGIGLTNPTALLNVYGETSPYILVEDGSPTDNQARINFKSPSYEWSTGLHGGEDGKFKISYAFAHGNNDYLTILTNGAVGIGTITPARLLHLHETSSSATFLAFTNTTTGSTASDGALIGIQDNESLIVSNKENNHIEFHTNNTERLRIDSSGRVLISGQAALTSTSLTHSLQVACSSDADGIAIIGRADDIGEISFYEADKTTNLGEIQYRQDHVNFRHRVGDIRFATGGTTERLRIDSDGRLIAGGATASNAWTGGDDLILGNTNSGTRTGITLVSHSGSDGGIYWSDGTAASAYRGQLAYNHANDTMSLYTAAAARLRITSGGIVLINDANVSSNRADAPLQIETGANGNALNLRAREGDNIYSYLNFQNNAGSQTAAHIYLQRDASTNAGTLVFGTAAANANTPTERLHITSAGRVGIGDASPDTKLTVKAGSGDQLRLDNSGERYTQISLRNNGSQKAAIWFDNTNNQFDIYGSTNVGIRFLTGGSEKVRITSAGEVRISNTDITAFNFC